MRKLGLPIIAFSLLGLISLFVPMSGHSMFSVFSEFDKFRLVLMLAAFAVPPVMAVAAMRATRTEPWHGYVALLGFALATVKSEVWVMISHITQAPAAMVMLTVAICGGVLCTLLAVATEPRA